MQKNGRCKTLLYYIITYYIVAYLPMSQDRYKPLDVVIVVGRPPTVASPRSEERSHL